MNGYVLMKEGGKKFSMEAASYNNVWFLRNLKRNVQVKKKKGNGDGEEKKKLKENKYQGLIQSVTEGCSRV